MFDANVTSMLLFDKAPSLDVLIKAFEKHVWPCYRFHSCCKDGNFVATSAMDRSYHFREQRISSEADIDRIGLQEQLSTLDPEHPLWRITVLRHDESSWFGRGSCKSAVIINVHHALGDGLGLLFTMSPLMGVEGGSALEHVPLPMALLPPAVRKSKQTSAKAGPSKAKAGCLAGLGKSVSIFCRAMLTSILAKHDTELSINAPLAERDPLLPYSGSRVFARLPVVPMAAVNAVRKNYDCSVNDAVMAAIAGTMRRYAIEIHGDKVLKEGRTPVECKSFVMIALPRKIDDNDLTSALLNKMLFAPMRIPIEEPSPQGRMARIVAGTNDLKSKAFIGGLKCLTDVVTAIAPKKFVRQTVGETFSKQSMLVTNVPATTLPFKFPAEGGEVCREVYPVICNVMPQVSLVSYNQSFFGSICADPKLYPDLQAFGKMWLEEFEILAKPCD